MDYNETFSRNIGFITRNQQKSIKGLSVGIAGAGGDGGLLAERLTRFGIGKIVMAEPDTFELANCNRQFGANLKTCGHNKAEVIAKELKLINPKLKILIFKKGITEDNVADFVSNSDVIIDEIEYSKPSISAALAKEARRQHKYVFMGANIGWGASIFCFSPRGITFEKYFKYDSKTDTIDPIRYVQKIPRYFDKKLLARVLSGKIPMPSLSSSVGLVASFLSSQIIMFAITKKNKTVAPHFWFIDSWEMKIDKR